MKVLGVNFFETQCSFMNIKQLCEILTGSVCLSIYVSVRLYMCLSVYICVSVCLYMSVCLSIYVCLYMSVCLSIYVSVRLYMCVCLSIYVCLSLYICVCLSIYVSVCLYMSVCEGASSNSHEGYEYILGVCEWQLRRGVRSLLWVERRSADTSECTDVRVVGRRRRPRRRTSRLVHH